MLFGEFFGNEKKLPQHFCVLMLFGFFVCVFCCYCWNAHKSVHIFPPYLIVHNSAFDFFGSIHTRIVTKWRANIRLLHLLDCKLMIYAKLQPQFYYCFFFFISMAGLLLTTHSWLHFYAGDFWVIWLLIMELISISHIYFGISSDFRFIVIFYFRISEFAME